MQDMNPLRHRVNPDVTACLVVHNEEPIIARCLDSLKGVVGRIVVVHDGLCSDRTLDICRGYGCDVFERDFVGMCEGHRIFAYSQVSTKWILQVDADEFLSDELAQKISELLLDENVACYEFRWPYWDGVRYRTKNWPYRRALFRKDRIAYLAFPHEEIRPWGPIKRMPYVIEHRPNYDNYSFYNLFHKHQKWIKIHAAFHLKHAADLERYPDTASHLQPHYNAIGRFPIFVAPIIFCYHLVGLLTFGGLRAGWYGIRNSVVQSAYYFMLCCEVFRQKREVKASKVEGCSGAP